MSNFDLRPDYLVLSQYIDINQTSRQLIDEFEECHSLFVEHFNTKEKVVEFRVGLNSLLENFQLVEHHDNLLALSLLIMERDESLRNAALDHFRIRRRNKEINDFIENCSNDDIAYLGIKHSSGKITKIEGVGIVNWIGELLQRAISNGDVPKNVSTYFGAHINASCRRNFPTNNIRTFLKQQDLAFKKELGTTICKYLYDLAPAKGKESEVLSNRYISFVYQLMVLLKIIKGRNFTFKGTNTSYDSYSVQYLRSLLQSEPVLL